MLPYESQEALTIDTYCMLYEDRPFLKDQGSLVSYRDFGLQVSGLIHFLENAGVKRGQVVVAYRLSPLETIATFFACLAIGAIFSPVNDKYPPDELDCFLDQIPKGWLLAGDDIGSVENRWRLKGFSCLYYPYYGLCAGMMSLEREISFESDAAIIFTSGSSGRHKGVLHSVGSLVYSALGSVAFYKMGPEDCWLLSLPLFHIGGLMIPLRCFLSGALCDLDGDPKQLAQGIMAGQPSLLSLVPTQLYRLCQGEACLQQLRQCKAILIGGASCPAWLTKKALDHGLPLSLTYGSSEAASQLTATRPGEFSLQHGYVGMALPYREWRLQNGLIAFRGGNRFRAYYCDGQRIEPFDAEGWYLTQDAAILPDSEQGLIVRGRVDQTFICGGENIAPREIEAVLEEVPFEGSLLVVPVADAEYGAVPVLMIWSEEKPPFKALLTTAKKRLPGIKVPRRTYWYRPSEADKDLKPSTRKTLHLIDQYESHIALDGLTRLL